jgi:hypothetical protein
LAAVLALACAAARAEAPSLSALTGAWAFETAAHHVSGCVIAGTANATLNAARNALAIDIRAKETCPNGEEWRAREACHGALQADRLLVTCRLIDTSARNYNPDNFLLQVISPVELTGALYDVGVWNDAARWRRPSPDLVS